MNRKTRALFAALTALLSFVFVWATLVHPAIAETPQTKTVAWLTPTPNTAPKPTNASNVGWPQSYVGTVPECGPAFWYQVDTYRYSTERERDTVDDLIASGWLQRPGLGGSDSSVVESWYFTRTPPCLTSVTPPVLIPTPPTCDSPNRTVVVPTIEGINFEVNGANVNGQTLTVKPGESIKIIPIAQAGYVIPPSEHSYTTEVTNNFDTQKCNVETTPVPTPTPTVTVTPTPTITPTPTVTPTPTPTHTGCIHTGPPITIPVPCTSGPHTLPPSHTPTPSHTTPSPQPSTPVVPQALPNTGSNVGGPLALGALLLALGSVLILVARKRLRR